MNILIIDKEENLAHKIFLKAQSMNYICHHSNSISKIDISIEFDIVLYTFESSLQLNKLLKLYNKNIILLLGFQKDILLQNILIHKLPDYILKPFSLEHLFIKIEHFHKFNSLKLENKYINNYFNIFSKDFEPLLSIFTTLPIIIKSNKIDFSNKLAYLISKKLDQSIKLVYYKDFIEIPKSLTKDYIFYLHDFDMIKKQDMSIILSKLEKSNVIINTKRDNLDTKINIIDIDSLQEDKFLAINEYIEFTINKYENKFSNVELSSKLGICRKTLWKKRMQFKSNKNK